MAKMTEEEKAAQKAEKALLKAQKKEQKAAEKAQKKQEKALKKFEKKTGMSYQECVSQIMEDEQNGKPLDPKVVKLVDKTQNSLLAAEIDYNNTTKKIATKFEKKTGQTLEAYIQSKQPEAQPYQPEQTAAPRAQEREDFAPIGTRDVYGNKIDQPTASADQDKRNPFDWSSNSNSASSNTEDWANMFLELIVKAYARLSEISYQEELARIRMREDRLAAMADKRAQQNVAQQENQVSQELQQTREAPQETRSGVDLPRDKNVKEVSANDLIRMAQQRQLS